jgi:hypothetical protein
MIIGVVSWELEIHGAQSLKEKRSVVRSLRDRLRKRHNLSVAETAYQDLWQRAELTVCVVASARTVAEQTLEAADRLVAEEGRARIIRTDRSFL